MRDFGGGCAPGAGRLFEAKGVNHSFPIDGKPVRETPLFRIASADETFLMLYQIALSPDGKTIAASAGLSEEDQGTREPDRALYLLDLSRAGRPVKKIRIPRAAVVPAGLK